MHPASKSSKGGRGRGSKPESGTGGVRGGRGGSRGGRGRDRPNPAFIENQREVQDFVKSRPSNDTLKSKQGETGQKVELVTNFYVLKKLTNFNLFHYHVEFKPDEERTEVRKKLIRNQQANLGAFIFDGQSLFTPHRIMFKPMQLYSTNPYNDKKIQMTLKMVAEISPVEPIFLQVYNIIFRNIMTSLDLELLGRFYYDPCGKSVIPSRKLEVWPGYITSVRNHEHQILLNVEITHKVVRSDTVLDFIRSMQSSVRGDYKREVTKALLGTIVLTRYNKKNYKIDDIKWDVTPKDEFPMSGGTTKKYVDYYKEHYGMVIKDLTQPMLVSLPKKKDYHRGSSQPIYLIPEICQMTGLTDNMRKDFNLMKELTGYLTLIPSERMKKANSFLDRWYKSQKVVEELTRWNIEVERKPIRCDGRVVEMDDIIIGPKVPAGGTPRTEKAVNGDWTNVFKTKPMLSTVSLKQWALILPPQSDTAIDQMLPMLKSTGKSMGFVVDNPVIRYKLRDGRPASFSSAIQAIFTQCKQKVQMFLVILPNNNAEVYSAVKKKCYVDLGVSCQCIIQKTMLTKNLVSISARLAIQMNCKLGGEPWSVNIPLKNIMIIGYDVFHSPSKKVASVGAMVATTSDTYAKYFSSTSFHKSRNELSANLCTAMIRALHAYHSLNGKLPARIILFRDGVGDGQLSYVYNTELAQIRDALTSTYTKSKSTPPKFTFVVVTKRIHTRIFVPSIGGERNVPCGTIVDDVITLPERYDFFVVSQNVQATQGTVSPTSYNVLYDEQGLSPDKMQRLTLKLCHLYFNYTGTIAVPAPCQFAHKLAYLTGQSLSAPVHQALQNYLYFL